jgi:hypothetical protein
MVLGQTVEENIRGPEKDRVQGNGEYYVVDILCPPNIAKMIESRMRNWCLFIINRNLKYGNFQIRMLWTHRHK